MHDPISEFIVAHVISWMSTIIMPLMLGAFVVGIGMRIMVYYLATVEMRFSEEFEKRVRFHFTSPDAPKVSSFFRLTRILLDKTYVECFEFREKYKRRKYDYISSLLDRLFLIQDGVRRLLDDTLRQCRYFKKDQGHTQPKMIEVAKSALEHNPYFNRLLGIVPVSLLHEILNILPGLFLIGGILGTFLGISKGLPELGSMDLANMQETKRVMDEFLATIGYAMVKSIIGILFSASMTLVNTFFAVEGNYYNLVNRFASSLETLWNETQTNELEAIPDPQPAKSSDMRAA